MINKAEVEGILTGIKVAALAPSVTHLLFADDSLFFCKATLQEGATLAAILHRYEAIFGQKISLEKSAITFGKRITNIQRISLHNILGIIGVGGTGKYLGLPEQFGRKKIEQFEYIINRVRKKLDTWYIKHLSHAGKEILIKAVGQSMPVYSMNCFLLPKKITERIVSLLTEFWWGHNNGNRKIPWVAWRKMSLPKREGGLGFRDLNDFNKALLAKQAWRVLINPTSLLARIYKARYHQQIPFMQSRSAVDASYGWKSIQAGKELLSEGLRVHIGIGAETKMWGDHWLQTLPPRAPIPLHAPDEQFVVDFIDPTTCTWDEEKLNSLVVPNDVNLIKSMIISPHGQKDTYEWPYNQSGNYDVKSGYWLATHSASNDDVIIPPHGSVDLKKRIWKLKIPPKIQHFLWRCLSGAIPVACRLLTRNVPMDPLCQRCCTQEETINHILFLCQFAGGGWRLGGIPELFTHSMDLETNLKRIVDHTENISIEPPQRYLPVFLLWFLWKSRNELMFNKRSESPNIDVDRATEYRDECLATHTLEKRAPFKRKDESAWEPPPGNWLKCNFDASYREGSGETRVGWVVRDYQGYHLSSGYANIPWGNSAIQAEALGFLYVLKMVWARGWRQLWLENDSSLLVDVVNKSGYNTQIGNVLYDMRWWMQRLPLCSLAHINRERNQAADCLSKQIQNISNTCTIFDIPPVWLVKYLYAPYTI